jgi:hypothetical protein
MPSKTIRLFSVALFTLALGLVQAQAKSDFSGTWKLNTTKSDFGPLPAPDSLTEKIAHADPSLKVNIAQTGGTGDRTYDVSYTTDADDLSISTKGSFSGTDFTSKDRWNLSADGKTLTITRHITSAMGEADMKEVLEKQ